METATTQPRTTQRRAPPREDALRPAVIENVRPQVDCGRFAIKRTPGEVVVVEADVFADGHVQLRCLLQHRRERTGQWSETPMEALGNDRWRAEFAVSELGRYEYRVTAWVDAFLSWRHDFLRRDSRDQAEIALALQAGAALIREAAMRASAVAAKISISIAWRHDGAVRSPLSGRLIPKAAHKRSERTCGGRAWLE